MSPGANAMLADEFAGSLAALLRLPAQVGELQAQVVDLQAELVRLRRVLMREPMSAYAPRASRSRWPRGGRA